MRVLFLIALFPTASTAQCLMQMAGTNCVVVPQTQVAPPAAEVGDILPRGQYNMIMNAPYYGLPRAQDGWVYFRVEDDIMRVQLRTMEVLEIVTNDAARNGR